MPSRFHGEDGVIGIFIRELCVKMDVVSIIIVKINEIEGFGGC